MAKPPYVVHVEVGYQSFDIKPVSINFDQLPGELIAAIQKKLGNTP
jgi:hypothetical protein